MAIKALRGMKDILPPLSEKYLYFLQTASEYAHRFGFSYIETPLLEETALFKRSVGESSDIVGKEMYQFIDKGGNDIVLRPEGTAGVVRSFIEHKLDRIGGIHRYFYYGSMFRYERPQKGRFRQFHQFGVESFGDPSFLEDATIIMLAKAILDHYNLQYTLHINSLGCPVCLRPYKEELIRFLSNQERICDDCKRRRELNPIRVLDCKNEECQKIYKKAPKLINNLCSECNKEFEALKNLLNTEGVKYVVDENLVRGLDYYTRTAFEFISNALGAQNAIAGGGRYDNLVEMLGGKPTPAVGFAIGIERILDLLPDITKERQGYFIGTMLEEALPLAFHIATTLRKDERVIMEHKPKSLKALLKAADKNHAKYAVIIGEEEYNEGEVWIKDLEAKKEEKVDIKEFLQ